MIASGKQTENRFLARFLIKHNNCRIVLYGNMKLRYTNENESVGGKGMQWMVLWIFAFIILVPVVGLLIRTLEHLIQQWLGQAHAPQMSHVMQQILGGIPSFSLKTEGRLLWFTLAYLSLNLLGGSVMVTGGNLLLAILLLAIGKGALLAGQMKVLDQNRHFEDKQVGIAGAFVVQQLMIAIGLGLVVKRYTGLFDVHMSSIMSLDGATAYYLPGLTAGLMVLLILFPKQKLTEREEKTPLRWSDVLVEWGGYYETAVYLFLIFLFHYAGTTWTILLGLAVCGIVQLLKTLLYSGVRLKADRMPIKAITGLIEVLGLLNILAILLK